MQIALKRRILEDFCISQQVENSEPRLSIPVRVTTKRSRKQRNIAVSEFCFYIDATLCRVVARSLDADDVVFKVDVFPFKTEHFAPAETAVRYQKEKGSVLRVLTVYCHEKLCDDLEETTAAPEGTAVS